MRMQPGDLTIRTIRSWLVASMVLTAAALVVGAQGQTTPPQTETRTASQTAPQTAPQTASDAAPDTASQTAPGTALQAASAAAPDPASNRWEKDIQRFEAWDAQNAWPADGVLFVGSSSIRMWKTRECFPDLPVINRGFGGSQIPDVLHFVDRIVLKYRPAVVVFYCGDNDIAAGRRPEQVFADWRTFVARVRAVLPQTPIVYLGIKPSGARWALWPRMNDANLMIRNDCARDGRLYYVDTAVPIMKEGRPDDTLFLSDRLHLNTAGYARWTAALRPILDRAIASTSTTRNPRSARTEAKRRELGANAQRKGR